MFKLKSLLFAALITLMYAPGEVSKKLFLLCACLLANFNAPETTATVRGMDGDDNASIVRHESGISGRELAKIIWEASPVFCAKLQLGLYLGAQELKTVEVVPDGAEIGRLCRGSELRVDSICQDGYCNIRYGELSFKINVRPSAPFIPGSVPLKLEDLSSSNCLLVELEGMPIHPKRLSKERIYLMQAVHDFAKANPEVELTTLRNYFNIIPIFSIDMDNGEYNLPVIEEMFPEVDFRKDDKETMKAMIEQIQTNANRHARNMREIMEDAGIRVQGLRSL